MYRKYRSLSLTDIVGQPQITTSLGNAIKNGNISHAYLFTGPKGTGKTSVARILAHNLNKMKYQVEDNYVDIIEIDAASNRRIDEIRDLLEKAHIMPVSAKYKVYIIDEVHMLTKEAFNALLKTLEEPPSHVIFILATTELHKLPQTIISRTQKHTFKPIAKIDTIKRLEYICKKESINIDESALELIADHSEGSLRDALSILDQVSSIDTAHIKINDIQNLLGLATPKIISSLIDNTLNSRPKELILQLNDLKKSGIQVDQIVNQLVSFIQGMPEYFNHLKLVEKLIAVNSSPNRALALELTLLESAVVTKGREKLPLKKQEEVTKAQKVEVTHKQPTDNPEPIEDKTDTIQASGKLDGQTWSNVITLVKNENNAIASILRSSKPNINGNEIVLHLKFKLHQKKLNDPATKELIASSIKQASGNSYTISSVIDKSNFDDEVEPSKNDDNDSSVTDSIIETFGGGERITI